MKLTTHNTLPIVFIILYGSGFIGTKYGVNDANPLSFLSWRFYLASAILMLMALFTSNIKKHAFKNIKHISVAGFLSVGLLSIGIFGAIDLGLSPALAALIIALQPILIALLAKTMLNEHLTFIQWFGLLLGLLGVASVVYENIELTTLGLSSLAMAVLGLLGLTFGNLYQKKYCSDMNLFVGGAIQSFVSATACLLLLLILSEYQVIWSNEFKLALGYMTVGVSVGALSLLYVMIRHGDVSKVASLFYLVPVVAAIISYFFMNETFTVTTIIGTTLVMVSLVLINKAVK